MTHDITITRTHAAALALLDFVRSVQPDFGTTSAQSAVLHQPTCVGFHTPSTPRVSTARGAKRIEATK
jgi:hypothetical protein